MFWKPNYSRRLNEEVPGIKAPVRVIRSDQDIEQPVSDVPLAKPAIQVVPPVIQVVPPDIE